MGPDLRLVFIGGGSGIASLGPALVRRGLYSYHLVAAFDSGGSSGLLRRHLGGPPPGDLRNRLLALADRSYPATASLAGFLNQRLPEYEEAAREIYARIRGQRFLEDEAAGSMAVVQGLLESFEKKAGLGFPLSGACLGNLALLGGRYLFGSLMAAAALLAGLIRAPAELALVTEEEAELAAELPQRGLVVGQDRLTRLSLAEIKDFFLLDHQGRPVRPSLCPQAREFLSRADLVVIGPGSFFTSLLSCFLVSGLSETVAASGARVVLVPGSLEDPERRGLTPVQIYQIWTQVAGEIIDTLVLDSAWPKEKVSGVETIWLDLPFISGRYQAEALLEALLSLV